MKDIRFIGSTLPADKTTCGSPNGDIGIVEFIKGVKAWNYTGCAFCGDLRSTVFAFVSEVYGESDDVGICMGCIDRLNTNELEVANLLTRRVPPVVREADKNEDR